MQFSDEFLSALISTGLQVGVVLVIALVVYAFWGKTRGGFGTFTGLKSTTGLAAAIAVVFAAVCIIGAQYIPGLSEAAKAPNTVVGKLTANGVSNEVIAILVITALIKTSFSEELLFRGIIGKRLMAWLGFHAGNLIQAALFGAIHLLLFLSPEVRALPLRPEYVVAFTGLSGWFSGWLNEKVGNGSIIPGWIGHGLTNLATYLGIALGYM